MAQTNGSTHLVEEQRLAMRQGLRLRDELTDMLNTTRSKADGVRQMRHRRQPALKSGLTCFERFCSGSRNMRRLSQRLTLELDGYCRFNPRYTATR